MQQFYTGSFIYVKYCTCHGIFLQSCVIQPSLPLPGSHECSTDAQGLNTLPVRCVIFFLWSFNLTNVVFPPTRLITDMFHYYFITNIHQPSKHCSFTDIQSTHGSTHRRQIWQPPWYIHIPIVSNSRHVIMKSPSMQIRSHAKLQHHKNPSCSHPFNQCSCATKDTTLTQRSHS